jgi:flagellar FliL protein
MAIASMICGIIGLLGFLFSGLSIFNLQNKIAQLQDDLVSLVVKLQLENRLSVLYFFFVISIILIILAFIFGIIERKKGKTNKYYRMANAGFIMGLVGISLPILYIIFVTGISIITYNIMKKEKASTVIYDPTVPNEGAKPTYSYYSDIGTITTTTKDEEHSVTVEISIGYDLNDNDEEATFELLSRRYEIREFVRRYFMGKTAEELSSQNEENIKQEIRELLNTRLLETARISIILFTSLDVKEK